MRPLATIEAADALDPERASGLRVALRAGLRPRIAVSDDTVTIGLAGKTVSLPLAARLAVERIATGEPVTVSDLPDLDAGFAVVVARRLLREGVLVIADGG